MTERIKAEQNENKFEWIGAQAGWREILHQAKKIFVQNFEFLKMFANLISSWLRKKGATIFAAVCKIDPAQTKSCPSPLPQLP